MAEATAALGADEARALLREFAVVVRPGETLILRVGNGYTPSQVRELQDALNRIADYHHMGFKVLVVPGDELAVAQPETDAAFAGRVGKAIQDLNMRDRFPMRPA
jgi:hypothetical protein